MKKQIIINSTAKEHRIAILEEGKVAELFVDTPGKERMVGDIYLGKVARVMPGIRAAFIDVGMPQDAFLHFSDIGSSLQQYNTMLDDETDDGEDEQDDENGGEGRSKRRDASHSTRDQRQEEMKDPAADLQKGKEILVQITKEPIGKKGVRVTSEVALPGRFLVLLPFGGKTGVSKKISSFKEKRRLRKIVREMLPQGAGAIIRTVAENAPDDLIQKDLEELLKTWTGIEKTVKEEAPPALIYKDLDTTSHVVRDLFSDDVSSIVMDDKRLYKEVKAYVQWHSPDMIERIELYRGREPIFDKYDVERDMASLMNRKIWLKSGGYIIIEKTEAMTVIDVNSGRYAANKEQEMNSLKTNLEAARELCRQIRLRDIGGMIVVDFIDLEDERNKKKVFDEMRKELRRDRAKVTILPMTEFGLVQITRQRIRQNVQLSFSESCPYCGGAGMAQSRDATVNQIERWIRRFRQEARERRLQMRVHPVIADYFATGFVSRLLKLQFRYLLKIHLVPDPSIAAGDYKFFSVKQNKDITAQYSS
jgi:ribonuclease G